MFGSVGTGRTVLSQPVLPRDRVFVFNNLHSYGQSFYGAS